MLISYEPVLNINDPEKRTQRWLISSDFAHWRVCRSEYFYIRNMHLNSANPPSLIINEADVSNDYSINDESSLI